MMNREKRLHELIRWAENKGVDVTEEDLKTFEEVIRLAMNDGFAAAMRSTEMALNLASKYGADQTLRAIEKGVADLDKD